MPSTSFRGVGWQVLIYIQTLQALTNALGFPPEHDSKILLMNIPHTCVIESDEIQLKLQNYWIIFIVLESIVHINNHILIFTHLQFTNHNFQITSSI